MLFHYNIIVYGIVYNLAWMLTRSMLCFSVVVTAEKMSGAAMYELVSI